MMNLPISLCRRQLLLALALSPVCAAASVPYRDTDGAIRIEGVAEMMALIRRWNQLFRRTHQGERLRALGSGSDSAVARLTHGMTLIAAMDRPLHPLEKVAYGKINDARPLEIHVGYGRVAEAGATASSLALYLNRANPLDSIPLERLAGLLGQGMAGGDVTTWNQLGVPGAEGERQIHLHGLPETTATGGLVQQQLLKGGDFAAATEFVATPRELLARIAIDPWAIGVAPAMPAPASVKRVALASGGHLLHGSATDIQSGAYPLSRPLTLVLRRRKGEPSDPLALDYLRLALSAQGQAVLATQYVPLTPSQAEAERKKLV